MAKLQVYNLFNQAAMHVANTKYNSHEQRELRSQYRNMIKRNQQLPLYKLSLSQDTQDYVIGIKNAALELQTTMSFLQEDLATYEQHQRAYSDQPENLSTHLFLQDADSSPASFSLKVQQLATSQIIQGNFLPSHSTAVQPGTHFLQLQQAGRDYELEINTQPNETNLSIQERLATSINSSNMGLHARVIKDGNRSALELESVNMGAGQLPQGLHFQFHGTQAGSLVDYLGLNHITQQPRDAHFTLNGEEQTAGTNRISVNHSIEVQFLAPTNGTATINRGIDYSFLEADLGDFIDYYNHLIQQATTTSTNPRGSSRLLHELQTIRTRHGRTLEAAGFDTSSPDGSIYVANPEEQKTSPVDLQQQIAYLKDFQQEVLNTAKKVMDNPMDYVDKLVISYPNSQRNFPNPYMPSIYSGMLYNQYI